MYSRFNNNQNVRVASPKEVVIMLLVIAFVCGIQILYCQYGSVIIKRLNTSTHDSTCEVVDIYICRSSRISKKLTVFEDSEGRRYEIKTTKKDYVGRKCELSVSGNSAYRISYELPVLNVFDILCIIFAPFCLITIPIFLSKVKKLDIYNLDK